MGLPLQCKCSHDRQAAEEHTWIMFSTGLVKKPGPFYLNLSNYLFDKGKPAERQGRKAMGLPLCHPHGHDRQATENKKIGLCLIGRLYQ